MVDLVRKCQARISSTDTNYAELAPSKSRLFRARKPVLWLLTVCDSGCWRLLHRVSVRSAVGGAISGTVGGSVCCHFSKQSIESSSVIKVL